MMDMQVTHASILLVCTAGLILLQSIRWMLFDIGTLRIQSADADGDLSQQITVIVQFTGADPKINESVRTVLDNEYKSVCIVLINNAANQESRQQLARLQAEYGHRIKQIIHRQRSQPLRVPTLTRRYGGAGILLVLDAPHLVAPDTLRQVAERFSTNASLAGLQLKAVNRTGNWLSVTAREYASIFFDREYERHVQKSGLPLSSHAFAIRKISSSDTTTSYARSAVVYLADCTSMQVKLAGQRVMSVVLALLYCSISAVALVTREPFIFALGWLLFTGSITMQVVSDRGIEKAQKLSHMKHIMAAYVLFCLYYPIYLFSLLIIRAKLHRVN